MKESYAERHGLIKYKLSINLDELINEFPIWVVKQNVNLKDIKLQKEEVSDAKWVNIEELREMIK